MAERERLIAEYEASRPLLKAVTVERRRAPSADRLSLAISLGVGSRQVGMSCRKLQKAEPYEEQLEADAQASAAQLRSWARD